jgi:hypothetical protein
VTASVIAIVLLLVALAGPAFAEELTWDRFSHGGAKGALKGRGGIEGRPLPLDLDYKGTVNGPLKGRQAIEGPRFQFKLHRDFVNEVAARIKAYWGFPCVKDEAGRCEFHSVQLNIEFGILESGAIQFVNIPTVLPSPDEIYASYAVYAVVAGSPYPPVPADVMHAMKPGSRGVVIAGQFRYIIEKQKRPRWPNSPVGALELGCLSPGQTEASLGSVE